jgi:hypothetical protein
VIPFKRNTSTKLNTGLLLFPLIAIPVIYILVCYGINGRLAARTENGFLFFMTGFFIFLSARLIRSKPSWNSDWLKLAAVLVLLSGKNFTRAVSDLPSAYLYNQVMNKRASLIGEARSQNRNSVELKNFKETKNDMLQDFPSGSQKFFRHLASYPHTIFFNDDLSNVWGTVYAEYYKIDSIKVDTVIYTRWGLDHPY